MTVANAPDQVDPHRIIPVVVNRFAGTLETGNGDLAITRAGRALRWLEGLKARVGQPVRVVAPDRLAAEVEAFVKSGHGRVGVGGGDGTLASAATVFLRYGAECVYLPLGTHNHFAKDLGIDLDPDTWDALLRSPRVAQVDVGLVNGRAFLNNLSVGLYPRLLRQRARLDNEKLLGSKRLASLWAVLQILRQPARPFSVRWETDDQEGVFDTRVLLIANNGYADRPLMPMSRRALDTRQLVMFSPRTLSPWGIVRAARYALAGQVTDSPEVDMIRARSIRLHLRDPEIAAAIDGEIERLTSPICVNHHPDRLQAVIPENAS